MILLIGYVMISLMILLTIFYLHNKHIYMDSGTEFGT